MFAGIAFLCHLFCSYFLFFGKNEKKYKAFFFVTELIMTFLIVIGAFSCDFPDYVPNHNWIFFSVDIPIMAIALILLIVSIIQFKNYLHQASFAMSGEYSKKLLNDLTIQIKEIPLFEKFKNDWKKYSNCSLPVLRKWNEEARKMSTLLDDIDRHNEECISLVNNLNFQTFAPNHECRLFDFSKKSFEEKLDCMNPNFLKNKQTLLSEKASFIALFNEIKESFLKQNVLANDLLKVENNMKEYSLELNNLKNQIQKLPQGRRSSSVSKQYLFLKESLSKCQKLFQKDENFVIQNANLIDLKRCGNINASFEGAFDDFVFEKNKLVSAVEQYADTVKMAQKYCENLRSYLGDHSKIISRYRLLSSKQNDSSLKEVLISYSSISNKIFALSKKMKSYIESEAMYEDVLEQLAMGRSINHLLFSQKDMNDLNRAIFELKGLENCFKKEISGNPNLQLQFIVLTDDVDGMDNLIKKGGPNFLSYRDDKKNNYLHLIYLSKPEFLRKYLKETRNNAVKALLFIPNEDLVCPIDYLSYEEAAQLIQPSTEKRTYTVPNGFGLISTETKKDILVKCFEKITFNFTITEQERAEAYRLKRRYEMIDDSNSNLIDHDYYGMLTCFFRDEVGILQEGLDAYSKFEKYLPSFLKFNVIKRQADESAKNLNTYEFELLGKVAPLLYCFIPSFNVRKFFASEDIEIIDEDSMVVDNVKYLLSNFLELKRVFSGMGHSRLPFLETMKKYYLNVGKSILERHPSDALQKKVKWLEYITDQENQMSSDKH